MIRLLCSVLLAAVALSAAAGPSIAADVRWVSEGGTTFVRLSGLSAEEVRLLPAKADFDACSRVLRVGVAGASRPMLGVYRPTADGLEFRPRFKPEPGLEYEASFDPAGLRSGAAGSKIVARHRAESSAPTPAARVLRVDPAVDSVPENLLKIYLTFSAPMSRGQVYRRARILDDRGKPVELAFLELGEELWDRSQTRITLLFDPGRIKSGLRPREEEGPILVAGKTYTLVVDADWPDAEGRPLAAGIKRTFRTGPADLASPDPKKWKVSTPAAGSREPLRIEFGETLDRALAARLVSVESAAGEPIDGSVSLDDATRVWTFVPASPWKGQGHAVSVVPTLEDLAGNSVAKPFEVDTFQVDRPEARTKPVTLPFVPR